jgi:acetyl esterase/lipase
MLSDMLPRLLLLVAIASPLAATPSFAQTPPAPTSAAPKLDPPPQGYENITNLWPEGAVPGAVGTFEADAPRLYSYPAAGKGPHPAVIVLPGGGYTHLVMEGEGGQEARWLRDHGISALVLQYRLWPRYKYPYPLIDGLRAIRMVRAHAKEWNIDPKAIGIWGFSAGGHMAGYLATAAADAPENTSGSHDAIDKVSAHPDFAIISYGRVDLSPKVPGTFGMATLVGPDAPQAQIDAVDPILHVTKDTSPSFIYATEHDEKVDSTNATHFFEALKTANVPTELHIFELGPHGTHMGLTPDGKPMPKSPELAVYPLLLQHWLQLHGWMPNDQ